MRKKKDEAGITLIELMISLGLFGLVVSAAGMMYFTGTTTWGRNENQVESQQNLRIAMNTLSSEIRKADIIEVNTHGIVLMYFNNPTKTYAFHSQKSEIRLQESNSVVAMHIEDCQFSYNNNLITISLTTEAKEGVQSRNYLFRINTRGKEVYVGE